ncbi:phage tail protein [Schleiferilactobacillus harbinensis]|uniref:Major tail protein n=1 Tax=Schleiferilactobacillus harbinensis DSM 16991 TaxID=1122147 RepID=A0A0R1XLC0_9LACO|nr:major tail protein [Schleiferilactobacillus harbinensis]KRM29188.1 major tail protein [Schleiferilactobacillus harbinensis DSM 16991]QFR65357.1 phage tail protein [Schleiferilactobacillus harbinensis]
MTLVGFKRATIQPFTADGLPDGKPVVIEGKANAGATVSAEVSGLSKDATKVAGSDIEYYISQQGVGNVSVAFGLLDIPHLDEARILGQKTVGEDGKEIVYVGSDTSAPYCGVLLEAKDLQGDVVQLGFFRGKFAKDKEEAKTLDPSETFKPDADSFTFSAAASTDDGDQNGEYVAKYIGSDADTIKKIRGQVLKEATTPAPAPAVTPTPSK